ncbi:hypothetical protein BH20ACI1_BH20ACI1_07930 [soil metagenome]
MPKPPHFFQAYPFSCVPACLRMVLAKFGIEKTEPELRSLCGCDETGTTVSKAIKAVEKCGLKAYKSNLVLDDLKNLMLQDLNPIVYLRISENIKYSHSAVIYEITNEKVFVLDPEIGEREFDINFFIEIWSRGLTIIIESKIKQR